MPVSKESRSDDHLPHRESFVPLHTTDLVDYLIQHPQLRGQEQADFRRLASLILALLHHVYRQRHERLTYTYAPLDPDRDCHLLSTPLDDQRERLCTDLLARLTDTLGRANYHRLSSAAIERAMSAASQWGVRMQVDFEALAVMEVYARGNVTGKKAYRSWLRMRRERTVEVQLYQRLIVIFRTRDANRDARFDPRRMYLRMFKNIPQQDVEMVLPATKVRMTLWDHGSIVLPSLYAIISTMWRTLRYAVLLTLIGLLKTAALVALVIFAFLYGLKSMFTYTINTRRRYHLNVAQNLVYQTLDNNAGAILRLLEEGEQQEACESVLAYFAAAVVLRQREDITLAEIKRVCEAIIAEATGIAIEFDMEDAARSLLHLGLIRACDERWHPLSLTQANRHLDETWDQWFG